MLKLEFGIHFVHQPAFYFLQIILHVFVFANICIYIYIYLHIVYIIIVKSAASASVIGFLCSGM